MELLDNLQQILGLHEPSEVDELILDELFNIEEFNEDHKLSLEQYDSLLHLSLNKIGLKSLKNLPLIPCLNILEIRDNKLDLSDLSEISKVFPRLIKLKIGGNPISNFENLKVLKDMGELKKLEIKDIPNMTDELEKQIPIIFDKLKNIEIINNKNRDGELIESSFYEEEESFEIEDGEEDEELNESIDENLEEENESENDFDSQENEEGKNKKKK